MDFQGGNSEIAYNECGFKIQVDTQWGNSEITYGKWVFKFRILVILLKRKIALFGNRKNEAL